MLTFSWTLRIYFCEILIEIQQFNSTGLDIKHLVYMPIGHVVLKIYVPCKNFDVPSQYLYKPCKACIYYWKNKCMPRLKNHMPCRARNHKSLCFLGQDLHALGTRARLNVNPCSRKWVWKCNLQHGKYFTFWWSWLAFYDGSNHYFVNRFSTVEVITNTS